MKFCFISAMFEFFNPFLSIFHTLFDLRIGIKIRIRHTDQIDNLFLRITDEHTMQDQFQSCMVICAVNATVKFRTPRQYKPLFLTETDMALFNVKFFCKFRNGKIAVCITHCITYLPPDSCMPNFKFTFRKCCADVKNMRSGVFPKFGTRCKHIFYRFYCLDRKLRSLFGLHLCRLASSANSALERFGFSFFIHRVVSWTLELLNFNRSIYRTNPFACQNKISYTYAIHPS